MPRPRDLTVTELLWCWGFSLSSLIGLPFLLYARAIDDATGHSSFMAPLFGPYMLFVIALLGTSVVTGPFVAVAAFQRNCYALYSVTCLGFVVGSVSLYTMLFVW